MQRKEMQIIPKLPNSIKPQNPKAVVEVPLHDSHMSSERRNQKGKMIWIAEGEHT